MPRQQGAQEPQEKNPNVSGAKALRILRRISILPALAALGFLLWEASRIPWQSIQNYMPRSPIGAAAAILGLYSLKTVVVVMPLYALYLTASLLFPPVWAVLISYCGLVIEMYLGYQLGHRLGQSQVVTRISHYQFSGWLLQMTERHPALSCFVIRFLPLPADVSNMLLGAFSIRLSDYYLFSLLGFTPKLLPFILAGEAATQAKTVQLTGMAILFILLEITPLLYLWIRNRKNKHS